MIKSIKVFVFLSGLIGIVVGVGLLFFPVFFQSSAGIDLAGKINLLSETRGPGSALFIAGLVIMSGAFRSHLIYLSLQLSTLIYLSYGLGRFLSLIIDGMPHQSLFMAMVAEILIGILSLVALQSLRTKNAEQA